MSTGCWSNAADRLRLPEASEGEEAVESARRLFRRTLASWACDLLRLRRAGTTRLSVPRHRRVGWAA